MGDGSCIPSPVFVKQISKSKMIRINDIQDALFHLVGWQQAYSPKQWLTDDVTESESGLYFQQAHPPQ